MKMHSVSHAHWQFYWRRWHLGFDKDYCPELGIWYKFLFIGPLQLQWYSDAY